MSGFAVAAGQALLLLTIVSVRPASPAATRMRLLLQDALLAVCLLAACVSGVGSAVGSAVTPAGVPAGGGGAPGACCLAAVLLEGGVLLLRTGHWRDPDEAGPLPAGLLSWWPVAACVLLGWLSLRLLPLPPLAGIALALVLCGLLSLLVARDERGGWCALLQAGHGVLVFVGAVAGPGWPGLLLALPLQAVALIVVCRRPVWSDASGFNAG